MSGQRNGEFNHCKINGRCNEVGILTHYLGALRSDVNVAISEFNGHKAVGPMLLGTTQGDGTAYFTIPAGAYEVSLNGVLVVQGLLLVPGYTYVFYVPDPDPYEG